ncbi:uncharacterized protein KGF55_000440 [Candida pseudojiufengensis]|uniref:uncharacterized protein n=1 Tax=Candida pseudojiufengensis TaxID=497109 RepID=UPI0022251274|nr:uncharacterized protein KGF55_000440 [Candida pseudojiufengensis]KAI5967030.1 hypothetical protein KGF55_000440 [Candida pseudojiufengensis]
MSESISDINQNQNKTEAKVKSISGIYKHPSSGIKRKLEDIDINVLEIAKSKVKKNDTKFVPEIDVLSSLPHDILGSTQRVDGAVTGIKKIQDLEESKVKDLSDATPSNFKKLKVAQSVNLSIFCHPKKKVKVKESALAEVFDKESTSRKKEDAIKNDDDEVSILEKKTGGGVKVDDSFKKFFEKAYPKADTYRSNENEDEVAKHKRQTESLLSSFRESRKRFLSSQESKSGAIYKKQRSNESNFRPLFTPPHEVEVIKKTIDNESDQKNESSINKNKNTNQPFELPPKKSELNVSIKKILQNQIRAEKTGFILSDFKDAPGSISEVAYSDNFDGSNNMPLPPIQLKNSLPIARGSYSIFRNQVIVHGKGFLLEEFESAEGLTAEETGNVFDERLYSISLSGESIAEESDDLEKNRKKRISSTNNKNHSFTSTYFSIELDTKLYEAIISRKKNETVPTAIENLRNTEEFKNYLYKSLSERYKELCNCIKKNNYTEAEVEIINAKTNKNMSDVELDQVADDLVGWPYLFKYRDASDLRSFIRKLAEQDIGSHEEMLNRSILEAVANRGKKSLKKVFKELYEGGLKSDFTSALAIESHHKKIDPNYLLSSISYKAFHDKIIFDSMKDRGREENMETIAHRLVTEKEGFNEFKKRGITARFMQIECCLKYKRFSEDEMSIIKKECNGKSQENLEQIVCKLKDMPLLFGDRDKEVLQNKIIEVLGSKDEVVKDLKKIRELEIVNAGARRKNEEPLKSALRTLKEKKPELFSDIDIGSMVRTHERLNPPEILKSSQFDSSQDFNLYNLSINKSKNESLNSIHTILSQSGDFKPLNVGVITRRYEALRTAINENRYTQSELDIIQIEIAITNTDDAEVICTKLQSKDTILKFRNSKDVQIKIQQLIELGEYKNITHSKNQKSIYQAVMNKKKGSLRQICEELSNEHEFSGMTAFDIEYQFRLHQAEKNKRFAHLIRPVKFQKEEKTSMNNIEYDVKDEKLSVNGTDVLKRYVKRYGCELDKIDNSEKLKNFLGI